MIRIFEQIADSLLSRVLPSTRSEVSVSDRCSSGLIAAVLIAVVPAPAPAQSTGVPEPGADWPRYSGDLAGTRYSPLTEINAGNVTGLETVWTYGVAAGGRGGRGRGGPGAVAAGRGGNGGVPDEDGPPSVSAQVTPIVVDGVMYLTAGRNVVAVEAHTGGELWRRPIEAGSPSTRGVAYWPGDGDLPPRIIFTAGPRLMALDARTGEVDRSFGTNGESTLLAPWGGVPTIFRNAVIVGADNGENSQGGLPGDTQAYDARSGDLLWTFETIAQPGDPNFDGAWLDGGWDGDRAGVNHWGWYLTVDEAREILYMSLGSPAGNYWGGDRPGTNLYGNSVVAVDATTGTYLWHFQTVHHDLWDSDQPTPPALIDIRQGGDVVPALALIGKTSYMFILNRVTGEPIHGVEERPVPRGTAPGEWYSPTQPFPVVTPPLARVSFVEEDLVTAEDTSEEHARACRDLFEAHGGFNNQGPFTPWTFQDPDQPVRSNIQFPGNGGTNWGGPAADPEQGYIFAFTQDAAFTGWIELKREGGDYGSGNGSPQPYDRGSINGPGPYSGFAAMGMPCQKPPWGRVTAVDAATGEFAWQVTVGVSDDLPEGKQDTGRGGSAGPIATAGRLVFIGATSDQRFRALDSGTGEELWVARLPANASANPMTYQGTDRRQYVAITAGGRIHAFGLR